MHITLSSCQISTIALFFGGGDLIQRKWREFRKELSDLYQDYNSSYDNLLCRSQLPSLRVRRLRAISLVAFKIFNNQTPVYLSDLLTYKSHSYSVYLR